MKVRDLLYIAFREARILQRPQSLNSNLELKDGLIFLNQLIDYWAARSCYAWTTNFLEFPLAPGHQPHLIGPNLTAPDFALVMRPTAILSASVILPGAVDIPIRIRDDEWWASQSLKSMQSTMPTDLMYSADSPNGELWFWPVPNGSVGVRLEVNVVLYQLETLDDIILAPPAYVAALTLTLAEELCDLWGVPMPPNLARRALKARDALQSNNNLPPRISTADHGTSSGPSADFNWATGTMP